MPQRNEPDELRDEQIGKLEQLKKDYASCFSSEAGKRVLADLESKCFINQTTFSATQGRTLFNEGMRFVVVNIKNMMVMNIEKLKKLIQDAEE